MKGYGICFTGPRKAEVREVNVPDPGPSQVQVRCIANGICMGDVARFTGVENPGYPCAVGHEGIGVVIKAGTDVKHLREGDYVPSLAWATLENRDARGVHAFSRPPADPATVLTEPVACIVSALYSYNITPGDRVLVLGAGFMGLLNIQGLAHCPIDELVVTDIKARNLELARACGATEVIRTGTPDGDARLEELKQHPFDLVVECAGVESTIAAAPALVRGGGRLAIFAWHHGLRKVDMGTCHVRGLTLLNSSPGIGIDHNVNTFERAQRLIERGVFDLTDLVTHRHCYRDVQQAMEVAASRPPDYIKGVLLFED